MQSEDGECLHDCRMTFANWLCEFILAVVQISGDNGTWRDVAPKCLGDIYYDREMKKMESCKIHLAF